MSIQVNTGNAKSVNWEQILSSIGDVQKANSVDGKETFTVKVKEGGVPSSLTVKIPDDLELPDTVDSASLQSLVDKLSASGVKFSDAQIVQIKDAIVKAYGAMAGAANGSRPTGRWRAPRTGSHPVPRPRRTTPCSTCTRCWR